MAKTQYVTQTALADMCGVNKSTVSRWLKLPDCPDPQKDIGQFLAWASLQEFSRRGPPSKAQSFSVAELKASKVRADVVKQWQKVREYDEAIRADQEAADWTDMQDILAEYRSILAKVSIDDDARAALNDALATAVERVRRKARNALVVRDESHAALHASLHKVAGVD